MQTIYFLLFAMILGFMHTFEIDHVAAIANLVHNKKNNLYQGLFWGVGHSIMIIFIGFIIIVLKYALPDELFYFLESSVGVVLILLGATRLWIYRKVKQQQFHTHEHQHRLALGVGLVHGLAGSGVVVALAVAKAPSAPIGMIYLSLFGVGSIVGMISIAFVFEKILRLIRAKNFKLFAATSYLTSLFCIVYGIYIIYTNMTSL